MSKLIKKDHFYSLFEIKNRFFPNTCWHRFDQSYFKPHPNLGHIGVEKCSECGELRRARTMKRGPQ